MEFIMASFKDQISELSNQIFEQFNINTFPLVPVDKSRREYEENKEYEIPVDLIFDNPCEIRKHIDQEELEAYANQYAQELNRQEQDLEQEKLTLETQIKAIEAEYQAVEDQEGQNIENDAIKLS